MVQLFGLVIFLPQHRQGLPLIILCPLLMWLDETVIVVFLSLHELHWLPLVMCPFVVCFIRLVIVLPPVGHCLPLIGRRLAGGALLLWRLVMVKVAPRLSMVITLGTVFTQGRSIRMGCFLNFFHTINKSLPITMLLSQVFLDHVFH